MSTFGIATLVGLDERHLISLEDLPGPARVHREILPALSRLAQAARQAGFELRIASGYRSFEQQLAIWNAKAVGERPLLDGSGQRLNARTLSKAQRLEAIMRWSALPGASRHHWGTDIDVYDASALTPGQRVQLTQAETEGEGPFAPFHTWLTRYLSGPENPGFYRPYDCDRGGISPEPWHLSYGPVAQRYARAMSPEVLQTTLASREVALKAEIMAELPTLFDRFVRVPEAAGLSDSQTGSDS